MYHFYNQNRQRLLNFLMRKNSCFEESPRSANIAEKENQSLTTTTDTLWPDFSIMVNTLFWPSENTEDRLQTSEKKTLMG